MDASGVITLQAESAMESYALNRWAREALVMQDDPKRREQCHWRGSRLVVIADHTHRQEPKDGHR